MTISTAPTVPNPTSASFAADAYAFTQWMAAAGAEMNTEIARINALGFGSYSATSTTSLTFATGSQSLTVQAGKGFAPGQPIMLAETATPTNNMVGTVTSYDSTTGALIINASSKNGTGTVTAWTVSVGATVVGGGVSPDSIVVLTSGTSWTCPTGVTKAHLRIGGAGAGGTGGQGAGYRAGAAGGYLEAVFSVVPGVSYTYAIGAGGAGGAAGGSLGGAGGTTTFTANGITYTATGGQCLANGNAGGTASGTGAFVAAGSDGNNTLSAGYWAFGAATPLGNRGGYVPGANATGGVGDSGKIVLELYK